jgi:DNA-binding HxlR family transcriptional regulator
VRHDDLLASGCAIERTGAVLGERWVIAIVRAAYLRSRTFEDFQRSTGIARNILSDRLQRLVDYGILERHEYAAGAKRALHEYRLTEAGLDLFPVITALLAWGQKHTGLVNGPSLQLRHRPCGHLTEGVVVCTHCQVELDPHDVDPERGPGATQPSPAWQPVTVASGA